MRVLILWGERGFRLEIAELAPFVRFIDFLGIPALAYVIFLSRKCNSRLIHMVPVDNRREDYAFGEDLEELYFQFG